MKGKKRFEVLETQGMGTYSVIVDNETGVNYLYVTIGPSGGLTVLLDADGKPIITK